MGKQLRDRERIKITKNLFAMHVFSNLTIDLLGKVTLSHFSCMAQAKKENLIIN